MGGNLSLVSVGRAPTLSQISKNTYFSERELQLLLNFFDVVWSKPLVSPKSGASQHAHPSGQKRKLLSKKAFKQYYGRIIDPLVIDRLRDTLLSAKGHALVRFEVVCKVLGILARGTDEEKLQLSFWFYDLNNDGIIQREHVAQLSKAIAHCNFTSCSDSTANATTSTSLIPATNLLSTSPIAIDSLVDELFANGKKDSLTFGDYKTRLATSPLLTATFTPALTLGDLLVRKTLLPVHMLTSPTCVYEKEGFLHERRKRRWKLRYWRLRGGVLSCYKSAQSSEPHRSYPLSDIYISHYSQQQGFKLARARNASTAFVSESATAADSDADSDENVVLVLQSTVDPDEMTAWIATIITYRFDLLECPLLHSWFVANAHMRPDAIAVVIPANPLSPTSTRAVYTYKQLYRMAARVARRLCRLPPAVLYAASRPTPGKSAPASMATPSTALVPPPAGLVAVLCERGVDFIAALLGVSISGNAALLLDPAEPRLRIGELMTSSGVQAVLTQSWLVDHVDMPADATVIAIDALTDEVDTASSSTAREPLSVSSSLVSTSSPAVVLYQSGPGGRPRGVVLSHGALAAALSDVTARFAIGPHDRVFSVAPAAAPHVLLDIYGMLSAGGGVIVAPLPTHTRNHSPHYHSAGGLIDKVRPRHADPWLDADAAPWVVQFAEENATVWNSTPKTLSTFVDAVATARQTTREMAAAATHVSTSDTAQAALQAAKRSTGKLRLVLLTGDLVPPALAVKLGASEGILVDTTHDEAASASPHPSFADVDSSPRSVSPNTSPRDRTARIVAIWGAVETSVWSLGFAITAVEPHWRSVPVGKALSAVRAVGAATAGDGSAAAEYDVATSKPAVTVYLLEKATLMPCGPGTTGIMHIGGHTLASGYWREAVAMETPQFPLDAGPTRDAPAMPAFVVHPITGERLFRTGDVGKSLPNGAIELVAMATGSARVGGYAVDVAEVEARLAAHDAVDAAAVVPWPYDAVSKETLVAFVVATENAMAEFMVAPDRLAGFSENGPRVMRSSALALELWKFLRKRLPAPMVPSTYVIIDRIPKDRQALMDIGLSPNVRTPKSAENDPLLGTGGEAVSDDAMSTTCVATPYLAPRTVLEFKLKEVWEEALAVRPIGIRDDFFDLGGHSLLALSVLSLMEKFMLCFPPMPLCALWECPNIESLAARLLANRAAAYAATGEQVSTAAAQPTDTESDVDTTSGSSISRSSSATSLSNMSTPLSSSYTSLAPFLAQFRAEKAAAAAAVVNSLSNSANKLPPPRSADVSTDKPPRQDTTSTEKERNAARHAASGEPRAAGLPWQPRLLIGLQPHGTTRPLFLVHPVNGQVFGYRQLAACLAPRGRPLYAFQFPFEVGTGAATADTPDTIERLAEVYVDTLCGVQPQGPYLIGGYNIGGTVAWEMACQLVSRGHRVRLFLIDSYIRNWQLLRAAKVAFFKELSWPRFLWFLWKLMNWADAGASPEFLYLWSCWLFENYKVREALEAALVADAVAMPNAPTRKPVEDSISYSELCEISTPEERLAFVLERLKAMSVLPNEVTAFQIGHEVAVAHHILRLFWKYRLLPPPSWASNLLAVYRLQTPGASIVNTPAWWERLTLSGAVPMETVEISPNDRAGPHALRVHHANLLCLPHVRAVADVLSTLLAKGERGTSTATPQVELAAAPSSEPPFVTPSRFSPLQIIAIFQNATLYVVTVILVAVLSIILVRLI